jgi:hypothetical protein
VKFFQNIEERLTRFLEMKISGKLKYDENYPCFLSLKEKYYEHLLPVFSQ